MKNLLKTLIVILIFGLNSCNSDMKKTGTVPVSTIHNSRDFKEVKPDNSEVDSCSCEAFLYWGYKRPITVYNKPGQDTLSMLKNDDDGLVHMTILGYNAHYFYANIIKYSDLGDIKVKGWIEKSNQIGAFAKGEQEYMPLILYKSPNYDSMSLKHDEWKAGLITIVACDSNWAYVKASYKSDTIFGWIPQDSLYPNSY